MYRCQLQTHRAADVKNYANIYCNNKYKNRIQKETWCIKKKKFSFLYWIPPKIINSLTHTGIKGERSLPNTNLLWFLNQLIFF